MCGSGHWQSSLCHPFKQLRSASPGAACQSQSFAAPVAGSAPFPIGAGGGERGQACQWVGGHGSRGPGSPGEMRPPQSVAMSSPYRRGKQMTSSQRRFHQGEFIFRTKSLKILEWVGEGERSLLSLAMDPSP